MNKELASIGLLALGGFIVYEALNYVKPDLMTHYKVPVTVNGFAEDKFTYITGLVNPHHRISNLTAVKYGPGFDAVNYGNALLPVAPWELQTINPKSVTFVSNANSITY